MTELLIIFQLNTDKKTTIVSDMIIPVPKGLSNVQLMTLIKDTLATVQGAGAILNIINLNTLVSPKTEVVKDYSPRPERTSFGPKREMGHSNNGFSRGEGRPGARYGGHTARPSREDREPREDRPPREDSRPFKDESKGGYRNKSKPGGGYPRKAPGGGFRNKGGRSSRPSRSR